MTDTQKLKTALRALGDISALGKSCSECQAPIVTHTQMLPVIGIWYLCAGCAASEERLNENALQHGGRADPLLPYEEDEEQHVKIAREALLAITGHL